MESTIFIFANVSSLSGTANTGPAQSFIAGFTVTGIFVDAANNILYAADATDNTVAIYQSANAQSGVGFASGTIVGPDTGVSRPTGAGLDSAGRLVISNPGVPSLSAYPNPTSANGDELPAAVIKGNSTGLSLPAQMAATNAITNGALYVADSGGKQRAHLFADLQRNGNGEPCTVKTVLRRQHHLEQPYGYCPRFHMLNNLIGGYLVARRASRNSRTADVKPRGSSRLER